MTARGDFLRGELFHGAEESAALVQISGKELASRCVPRTLGALRSTEVLELHVSVTGLIIVSGDARDSARHVAGAVWWRGSGRRRR